MGNAMQLTSFVEQMNLISILPQIVLTSGALLLMLVAAMAKSKSGLSTFILSILIITGALIAQISQIYQPAMTGFSGMIVADSFSAFLNILYLVSGFLVIHIAHDYFHRRGRYVLEFHALIMFALVGMMFMTMATDIIITFLGLEILSVALYVLAGIDVRDEGSNESAVKYFLMGSFSSGFLLYGIAFFYGATGSTNLSVIAAFIQQNGMMGNIYIPIGLVMILVGFGFKISAAPFHMWTPDVYQGAPVVVTAFMSTAPKAAAFLTLVKVVLTIAGGKESFSWLAEVFYVIAILTMTIGNFIALSQENLKRMLAYSSIAHVGYMLIALTVMDAASILFYFTGYVFMNMGIFAVLSVTAKERDSNLTLQGVQGLGRRRPLLGALMVVFLFSLAGIPPLAGFSAKFFIFTSAIDAGYYSLAIIGILNSAVSAYYYIRVILFAYMKDPEGDIREVKCRSMCYGHFIVFMVTAFGVFQMGIMPRIVLDWSSLATSVLK